MNRIRKIINSAAAAAAIFSIFGALAPAQEPKRIQFETGKSSAAVKDSTGRYGITYVLRARSGQMLVLDLSPKSGLGIKVETDGRFGHAVLLREKQGGHFEVGLEESGDYTIFVGSATSRSLSFSLAIKIRKMADI